MKSLFKQFDNIIVFDVETSGTNPKKDEIIEFAALRVVSKQKCSVIEDEICFLVKLSPDLQLPSVITDLTGITEKRLISDGIDKDEACRRVVKILEHRNSLLVAYNAHFDLSFLYHFLNFFSSAALLKNVKMLDALTIYKDRKPYPHKLGDAIKTYSINEGNAHCAIDDAKATYELLCKMGAEDDDFEHYVNLFGYNPKYGVPDPKISSVKYIPQGYNSTKKLYE